MASRLYVSPELENRYLSDKRRGQMSIDGNVSRFPIEPDWTADLEDQRPVPTPDEWGDDLHGARYVQIVGEAVVVYQISDLERAVLDEDDEDADTSYSGPYRVEWRVLGMPTLSFVGASVNESDPFTALCRASAGALRDIESNVRHMTQRAHAMKDWRTVVIGMADGSIHRIAMLRLSPSHYEAFVGAPTVQRHPDGCGKSVAEAIARTQESLLKRLKSPIVSMTLDMDGWWGHVNTTSP